MRRLTAMSIIMAFILVSTQTISFSTYSNDNLWAEYYLDAITNDAFFADEKIKQHADYFLFDADSNGTPELVVCTNAEEYGEILYSVTEKGLSTIELPLLTPLTDEEMLNIGCVQEEGIILVSGYLKQGYIQQYLLTVTQETMQIEILGSILDNEALSKYGNGTNHFLWNGKALSLDEYADRMTALFDENKALQITKTGPFYYDYGDLISYLQEKTYKADLDSTRAKTTPENCWTPAMVSEEEYKYYQSAVQTYQSVTGGLCVASVDERDNVLEGYRPMSDHYVYSYQIQELNQYVTYLETEGFYLAYQIMQEGTDVYVYCNEEKGFALSIYVFTEREYVSIEPRVGWEELKFWTDKEYGNRDDSSFGTQIQKTNNIIELQYGEARYNAGYWNVPVFQPTEHMENCTGFTLCFGYSEVDERELGEHRVYVCLNESNSAWLECQPLNVATKGEVYRLNITFEKPRTVGGIAVLPRQATENKFSAIAWIEDPVFAD